MTETKNDTREKLEADVSYWSVMRNNGDDRIFIGWLDRQAAITERECMTKAGLAATDAPELQAKVDELAAENRRLQDKVDDLDKENAILVDMAGEAAEDAANFEQLLADMESTHMKLPLDADGVPIRPGDELVYRGTELFTCRAVSEKHAHTWDAAACAIGHLGSKCRHVKPDTLEGILQDLVDEVWEASCTCQTTWSDSGLDGIAERYAERTRQSIERERN